MNKYFLNYSFSTNYPLPLYLVTHLGGPIFSEPSPLNELSLTITTFYPTHQPNS